MLRYITQHPEIYDLLEARGEQLTGALVRNPPPGVTVNRVGAMFTLFFSPDPVTDWDSAKKADTERFAKYFQFMLERGVYLAPSQFEAAFLSTALSEDDINITVAAVRDFFAT
jgi:glutamate-1-semialdehyde 2,1-aminomutase